MTFWQDIRRVAGDEPIEAVLIGGFGWGDEDADGTRAVGAENIGRLLTADEAAPLLNYEYDNGFGGADCHEVFAWTASRVILVHEYDGATGLRWVPRNPAVTPVSMGGLDAYDSAPLERL
jgi:hypothetical protein